MTWILALVTAIVLVAFVVFGGVGGITAALMLVVLVGGVALYVRLARLRQSEP